MDCHCWYSRCRMTCLIGVPVRTVIALLLGAWMAGSVVVGGVAAENFFMIDRLLLSSGSPAANPSFQKDAAQLTTPEARLMLRYLVSELNRYYFNVWGWFELGLAVLLMALVLAALRERRFLIGFASMLIITAVMTFYITPRIIVVGRALDYVPREPAPAGMAEFGMLHGAYSILDLAKLALGVWMAVEMVRRVQASENKEPTA